MRITLFAVAMLLSFSTFAQVGTGLFMGGELGFTSASSTSTNGSTSTKGPVATTFSIKPRVGYFFTDNIAAGLTIGYASTGSKSRTIDSKSVSNTMSVGLFGRYALPLGDAGNFAFLGDLNLGFSGTSGKSETTVLGTTITSKNDPSTRISVGLAPGILFFPTPKIGLEANLGNIIYFSRTQVTDANNNDNRTYYTNFSAFNISSLSFNFGLNYYFNR